MSGLTGYDHCPKCMTHIWYQIWQQNWFNFQLLGVYLKILSKCQFATPFESPVFCVFHFITHMQTDSLIIMILSWSSGIRRGTANLSHVSSSGKTENTEYEILKRNCKWQYFTIRCTVVPHIDRKSMLPCTILFLPEASFPVWHRKRSLTLASFYSNILLS